MSQYASNSFPGIAGATGTRVDSASKHIMACKVHSAMLSTWCENPQNANNHMHIHKHKYCMTRDELVLNVGMPLNPGGNMIKAGMAYPAVVTTLGDMTEYAQAWLRGLYHDSNSGKKFIQLKEDMNVDNINGTSALAESAKKKVKMQLLNMPFFTAQGYSLGIAYASALTGDTVASVLIGGMCTVMNGGFECKAGQMLQWYFDFERRCFYDENESGRGGNVLAGTRRPPTNTAKELENAMKTNDDTDSEKLRKKYIVDRQNGAMDAYPHGGKGDFKSLKAYPKPYMLAADGTDHYGDKIRIFAKCINGARKHEMMDIMLMTQSL